MQPHQLAVKKLREHWYLCSLLFSDISGLIIICTPGHPACPEGLKLEKEYLETLKLL